MQASRVDGKVQHKTLLNLGTDFAVARDRWSEVACLAEDLLHRRMPLVNTDTEMRGSAKDIIRGLRTKGFRGADAGERPSGEAATTVDLDSVPVRRSCCGERRKVHHRQHESVS